MAHGCGGGLWLAAHRSAGFQPALLRGPWKRAGKDAGATKNRGEKHRGQNRKWSVLINAADQIDAGNGATPNNDTKHDDGPHNDGPGLLPMWSPSSWILHITWRGNVRGIDLKCGDRVRRTGAWPFMWSPSSWILRIMWRGNVRGIDLKCGQRVRRTGAKCAAG